jgi:dihydrofolate reductase
MRQLIVTTFVTLDGVMEAPGGGDHPHAGWTFKDVPFEAAAYEIKGREQVEAGALLIGRVSHDEFAPVWPSMEEFADYNAMPKYVVSSTLEGSDWHNTHVLRSLDDVAALKAGEHETRGDGPILVHGSATLAQGLAAAGLVDRYHLLVFPLLLGAGKRLFADDAPKQQLSMVEHQAFGNGITLQVFDVVH